MITRRRSAVSTNTTMYGNPVDELASDHAALDQCDRRGGEGLVMRDPREHAVNLGDELQPQAIALSLVPDRGVVEFILGDRVDAEVLHGFRARIASTAARARATESSRE